MQHVKYNADGSIWGVSDKPFPGAVTRADGAVVQVDGVWYDADNAPVITPEQERAEQVAAERARLCAELEALDAKGARAARAVALALVNDVPAASADVEKLLEIEEQAQTLRAEMGAL